MFQRSGICSVRTSLTSSTNTEYLKHRLALQETTSLHHFQEGLTERGIPLEHDP